MSFDELYNAGVNGDVERVRAILEREPQLLTEVRTFHPDIPDRFAVTGSCGALIVADTYANPNYAILELLAGAGLDLNSTIYMKNEEKTIEASLLHYAVGVGKNYEFTEFLLRRGANPDTVYRVNYSYGGYDYTVDTFYAISECKNARMLELMLYYGADPNALCKFQTADTLVPQELPLIYYAAVREGSDVLTQTLLRYGADVNIRMLYGTRRQLSATFLNYVRGEQPNRLNLLTYAIDRANASAQTDRIVKSNGEEAKPNETKLRTKDIGKKPYGKFAAYTYMNFLLIGVGFGVVAPLMYLKKNPGGAGIFFIVGLAAFAAAALVAFLTAKKAKKRGYERILGAFTLDGLFVFIKVMLASTLILIPLVKSIGRTNHWETITTTYGGNVTARYVGNGEYEDAFGNRYKDMNS